MTEEVLVVGEVCEICLMTETLREVKNLGRGVYIGVRPVGRGREYTVLFGGEEGAPPFIYSSPFIRRLEDGKLRLHYWSRRQSVLQRERGFANKILKDRGLTNA